MYASLITVHIIASVVLIMVILFQAGRGGGLSESFGFSSTQTFFGTSATKFLQRATSVCAVVFLLTCLTLAALSTRKSRSLMTSSRPAQALLPQEAPKPPETAPAAPQPIAAAQAPKQETAKPEPKQ